MGGFGYDERGRKEGKVGAETSWTDIMKTSVDISGQAGWDKALRQNHASGCGIVE